MTATDTRAPMISLCHIPLALLLLTLVMSRCASAGTGEYYTYQHVDIEEIQSTANGANENPMPIVGVLSQEVSALVRKRYPHKNITSYIAASYVKFVESAGGRVVPIWIGKQREYYEDIMSKINGILLPGGIAHFNDSNGYGDAARYIYEIAVEKNERGEYFPVWGTCLGFQYFFYKSANESDICAHCQSWGQGLPLEFKDDFRQSRMFKYAGDDVINILRNYSVTANNHHYCVTEEALAQSNLNKTWRVMSVNHDWNGFKFISAAEHKKYPFYGVQFHPEKTLFEFKLARNITHSTRATQGALYFANFFVSETRKNHQQFKNKTEEEAELIYNYEPTYTAPKNLTFMQQYFFQGHEQEASSKNAAHCERQSGWIIAMLFIVCIGRLRS